jgi:imidazolonepropionase
MVKERFAFPDFDLVDIGQIVTPFGRRALRGAEMKEKVGTIPNGYVKVRGGIITDVGSMSEYSADAKVPILNGENRVLLPGFVDAHTHLVFPKSREDEFVMRIEGRTYQEIAAAGGGILASARHLEKMDEETLFVRSKEWTQHMLRAGTTTIEVKSGYGLTVSGELKLLRVIQRLKEEAWQEIVPTYLALHALPSEYKERRGEYIREVSEKGLPAALQLGIVEYVDVFCEKGFFTEDECESVLFTARKMGFGIKVHANQLSESEGVLLGIRLGAVSVDHLEYLTEKDLAALQGANTVPVLLPGASFYLREPYSPVKRMLEAGLGFAIATDFNPGSSPVYNLGLLWTLACMEMRLHPAIGLTAITLNAAAAINRAHLLGSIEPGKRANLLLSSPLSSYMEIPYYWGHSWIETIFCEGKAFHLSHSLQPIQ